MTQNQANNKMRFERLLAEVRIASYHMLADIGPLVGEEPDNRKRVSSRTFPCCTRCVLPSL